MIVEPGDSVIVKWAIDHLLPWYYTHEKGLPDPCLKIHFGDVTAYFCKGRLTRVWAYANAARLDDMFGELLQLFKLCGHARMMLFEDVLAVPKGPGFSTPEPHERSRPPG